MSPQGVGAKVLVTGAEIDRGEVARLESSGVLVDYESATLTREGIRDRLKGFDYYLYGGVEAADELSAEDFLQLARSGLKLVAFAGKGVSDFLDIAAADASGVIVVNTPGAVEPSVAEFAVMLSLELLRDRFQRSLRWLSSVADLEDVLSLSKHSFGLGQDLADARVGIVGLGGIGSLFAEILRRGYRTDVKYYSRSRKPELERDLGVAWMPSDEIFRVCDLISIHLPVSEDSQLFVAALPMEKSESPFYLVNTSSQKLMPPDRLANLLNTGKVKAAAFDKIYTRDQIYESGLSEYIPDRLIVSAHSANATVGAWRRMTRMAVDAILAHASGQVVANGVGQHATPDQT